MTATLDITAEQLGAEIVRQAMIFLHLIETRPNADWDDPRTPDTEAALALSLREAMQRLGWERGAPYCMAFAGAMVILALTKLMRAGSHPHQIAIKRVQQIVSPHVMTTSRVARSYGALSDEGCTGALWLAQHHNSDKGHAGVVRKFWVPGINMDTVEGNTSADAVHNQREGEGIFKKVRTKAINGSLITVGFIKPEVWLA
jgi:hypothetical protein